MQSAVHGRQFNFDGGPLAGHAADVDCAVMGHDDGLADREAEAGPGGVAAGGIGLIEAVEDARQVFGSDADAGVLDRCGHDTRT